MLQSQNQHVHGEIITRKLAPDGQRDHHFVKDVVDDGLGGVADRGVFERVV